MTTEFDPRLQALFDQAEQPFDGERFLGDIMRKVDRQRHRTMMAWSLIGLVALIGFAFVASPLFTAVDLVSQFLPMSLVEIATEYELERDAGKTTLRLVHSGFGDGAEWDDLFDATRAGWAFELRGLRRMRPICAPSVNSEAHSMKNESLFGATDISRP